MRGYGGPAWEVAGKGAVGAGEVEVGAAHGRGVLGEVRLTQT